MTRVVAIIQARTDSTRLPKKALIKILEKPLILHVIERVQHAKLIDEIVLATTIRPVDDSLTRIVQEYGVHVFRGSYDDVLDRYYKAAIEFRADVIVRITGDCPLIDPQVIDIVIHSFQNHDDYVTNTLEPTYPDGLDVEVFSFKALEKTWRNATLTSEREHVTAFMRNHPEIFKTKDVKNSEDLSYLRWTVDQQEDIICVREIFKRLYNKEKIFYMKDVVELLHQHPELKEINIGIQRNEGYLRSLKDDKIVKK